MADNNLSINEQFDNSGISPSAFSYTPPADLQMPDQSVFPQWVNDIKEPAISKDITPEIRSIVNGIRTDALSFSTNKGDTVDGIISEMFGKNKIKASYTESLYNTHELLSDNKTWVPKYQYYKSGVDNEALNASMQSNFEKFTNPIKRFGVKVGRGIVADIGSFVYGLVEAAMMGRVESIFDNSMSNYIYDLDKKSDFAYKNYYNESQNGFGANLYSWEKVLGGVEFTARMIGAEAIIAAASGGTSLPASFAKFGLTSSLRGARLAGTVAEEGARASKLVKLLTAPVKTVAEQGGAIVSSEKWARALEGAVSAGKKADMLKQARFAITGSMYEAGFETHNYQNEAESQFWEYYRNRGEEPTEGKVKEFYDKLDSTSWGVFGANMAILSTSNAMLFGDMLNIKNPFGKVMTSNPINEKIFAQGVKKNADGAWKALQPNFWNKVAAYSAPVGKGFLTEGVYEEGSQGIASNMMKNYIASTYDPKAMKETSDYMSAFTKAFQDQFTTKDGLEEVVIGGIIGGLFGGVHGSSEVSNRYKKENYKAEVLNAMPQVADNIVSNLYTNENLASVLGHSNRMLKINEDIEKSEGREDTVDTSLKLSQNLVSMLQASHSVGKNGDFVDMITSSLKGMDSSQIAENYNLTLEEAENFKNNTIDGINDIADTYSKAMETAQYLYGRGRIGGFQKVEMNGEVKEVNNQVLIDAFAYTSAMGRVAERLSADSFQSFQTKLAETGIDTSIIEQYGTLAALEMAGRKKAGEYASLVTISQDVAKEKNSIERKIMSLDTIEGDTANKRLELGEKLMDINSRLETARENQDVYWKGIVDSFHVRIDKQGFLPQPQYDDFNKKVHQLRQALDTNTSLSEYDKLSLQGMMDSFGRANEMYESFANLTRSLTDPKYSYKVFNGLFAKNRAKNDSSLNDLTKDSLVNLYLTDTNIQRMFAENQLPVNVVNQQVVDVMNNPDFVPTEEMISSIADKLKIRKELSDNERLFYNKYKAEIDTAVETAKEDPIQDESPQTEIDQRKVQIKVNQKLIREIRKGNYPESLRDELNTIEANISDLKDQILQEDSSDKVRDLSDQILALNDLKDKVINDSISELEDSNKELKNELNEQAKIDKLKAKIEEAEKDVDDRIGNNYHRDSKDEDSIEEVNDGVETKPYYPYILRLQKLKEKLNDLLRPKKEFDPNASYEDQLKWIMDNIDDIPLDSLEDTSNLDKPSDEKLERYSDLLDKKKKTKKEKEELDTLGEELKPYLIGRSTKFGGVPLTNIVKNFNQIKNASEKRESQSVNITEEDLQIGIGKVQDIEYKSQYSSPIVGLVYDGAYVSGNEANRKLSHIKLNTVLSAALTNDFDISIQEVKTDSKGNKKYGKPIKVTSRNIDKLSDKYDSQKGIKININDDITLEKGKNDSSFRFNNDALMDLLDLMPYSIKGQSTSYFLLYKRNSDGSLTSAESEYNVSRNGVVLPFDSKALNSLKAGDKVSLFFDENDDYNKTLSDEEKASKGNIYVMKNGKLVNVLKASDKPKSENSAWATLDTIRQKAFEQSKNNKSVSIKISDSYVGFPVIDLDADGSAVLKDIDESKVSSYGYMNPDGSVKLFNKGVKLDNSQYVDVYKNKGKIIPVMAFEYRGKTFAFPISVENKVINIENQLDNILNNVALEEDAKIFEINSLISQYNLDKGLMLQSMDEVNNVRTAFQSVTVEADVTDENDIKDSYKQSFIDVNNPFMNSKLVFDFGSVSEIKSENRKKSNKKQVIESNSNVGKDTAKNNKC